MSSHGVDYAHANGLPHGLDARWVRLGDPDLIDQSHCCNCCSCRSGHLHQRQDGRAMGVDPESHGMNGASVADGELRTNIG